MLWFGNLLGVSVTVLVIQLCPTLCDPMESCPPGFSILGIFQARILELVAILFSRGSFQSGYWTWVSCTASRFLTICAIRKDTSQFCQKHGELYIMWLMLGRLYLFVVLKHLWLWIHEGFMNTCFYYRYSVVTLWLFNENWVKGFSCIWGKTSKLMSRVYSYTAGVPNWMVRKETSNNYGIISRNEYSIWSSVIADFQEEEHFYVS